jgi:HAD superfamily hydrolase (TIGR01509 family)
MIDTVVFDMDGVLVDTEPVYFERQMRIVDEAGIHPASRMLQDYIGHSADDTWSLAVPNDPDRRRVLRQHFEETAQTQLLNYREILIPGVRELLTYLHDDGYRVALASAGNLAGIEEMLRQNELRLFFDNVISGETIARNKPDPQIYTRSLAALGSAPQNSLAVEDSPTGIMAAHGAGMQAWALAPTQYHLDQSSADFVAQNMDAIQERLRAQER